MPRKRGPGGPWVAVRAHYGALPSMAGREWVKGGETCLDQRAGLAPAAGSTAPGTKKSPRRDAERRCRVPLILGNPGIKPRPLPRCAFRRSASLPFAGGRNLNLPLTQNNLRAAMTLGPRQEHVMTAKPKQQDAPFDAMRFRIELAHKLDRLVSDTMEGWRRCDNAKCRRARSCASDGFECLAKQRKSRPPVSPEQAGRQAHELKRDLDA